MPAGISCQRKIATELPKCGKTLHFYQEDARAGLLEVPEWKANSIPADSLSKAGFAVCDGEGFGFLPDFTRFLPKIWPFGCSYASGSGCQGEACMRTARTGRERRKWARLPLAIPVFVGSRDANGKEFLEFATALNVSAGGMLVAMRRALPAIAQIRLEIPSAPVAALALLPRASRTLRARALRTTPADGYYLLGLKFSRPLLHPSSSNGTRRKLASAV